MELSERLRRVASHIPDGAVLADIGSDHAYLPCYAVERGIVKRAIAGEVVTGPYESARRTVQKEGWTDRITVRLANGLEAIERADAVDTITIAGMGGPLIATILEQGSEALHGVETIIAQPNIHAAPIRTWAVDNGWYIQAEEIMEEDDKIYEIIVLKRGRATYDELDIQFGPILRREKHDCFIKKWTAEYEKKEEVLDSLRRAKPSAATDERRARIERERQQLERMIER